MMPVLERNNKLESHFISDNEFNRLYPVEIEFLAKRHWTPLNVARLASEFLAMGPNIRILDIGSGAGKFCLSGGYHNPTAIYFGVEQRRELVIHANTAKNRLGLNNVHFIHANFTQLDFKKYDNFYFYNSFFENLDGTDKIDDSIQYSEELFDYYSRYLFRQLDKVPRGTRLVTFHCMEHEVPSSFAIVDTDMDEELKCWIKL
jgi:hypothetical protein